MQKNQTAIVPSNSLQWCHIKLKYLLIPSICYTMQNISYQYCFKQNTSPLRLIVEQFVSVLIFRKVIQGELYESLAPLQSLCIVVATFHFFKRHPDWSIMCQIFKWRSQSEDRNLEIFLTSFWLAIKMQWFFFQGDFNPIYSSYVKVQTGLDVIFGPFC